jgi:hypothetical protein
MAKKNEIKKIFESMQVESAEAKEDITEPAQADIENETSPSEQVVETSPTEEDKKSSEEVSTSESSAETEEAAPEDLLEDVRRSLIEEESDKNKKGSKWWRRIGKKAKKVEEEQPPTIEEIDLPIEIAPTESVEEQEPTSESEAQEDEIDQLIDMLAAEREAPPVESTEAQTVEVIPEPEPEVDLEKLKEQAFRPPTEEEAEKISDVRSVALGDDEEVFVEVQPQVVDPWEERLKGFENALRPYRRYIYTALALLGVAMAAVAALIIFDAYKQSTATPVAEASNLPFPRSVSLPGGWSFALGKGTLQDGKWEPQGAEWLEGTEVCRWVALPWSRQLEAVIRTLNPKDPIELTMSNNDKFVYQVYSVRQLSPQEMQKLDSNKPCLLLILTQPDSEKRWVLTALP